MNKYMKMSDKFCGKVNVDYDGNLSDDKYHRGSLGDFDECYFDVISHAVNSHDELVETNNILLESLKYITQIKWRSTLAGLDCPTDFAEREAALSAFGTAVEIAKKTIKSVEDN